MTMLLLVLANALITATLKHTHKANVDRRTLRKYYYIEVAILVLGNFALVCSFMFEIFHSKIVFTILFDLEVLFKVFCLGFKSYIKRAIYKFEFILAIGTTLRLIPQLYQTELTYFQVSWRIYMNNIIPLTNRINHTQYFKRYCE